MAKPAETDQVTAIIDASSAILLYKADLLDIFRQALQLAISRSVFAEITVPAYCGADGLGRLVACRSGIKLLGDPPLPDDDVAADIDRLDRGERDTLLHYLDGAASFVILDDGKAVKLCRRHDIPHVNALLVPKLLFFSKRLSAHQTDHYFSRLRALGRYSEYVVTWAKNCQKGQLVFFLERMEIKERQKNVEDG